MVSVRQSVPDKDLAQYTLGDEESISLNPSFMQWKPLGEHLVRFKEDFLGADDNRPFDGLSSRDSIGLGQQLSHWFWGVNHCVMLHPSHDDPVVVHEGIAW